MLKVSFKVQNKDPSLDQERINFRARKQIFCQFNCWLDTLIDQSRFSIASSTPSSIDRDCDINKNLKLKKAHNFLISRLIYDLFVVLLKGHYKPFLERLFKERNHHFYGYDMYNKVSLNLTILETFKIDLSLHQLLVKIVRVQKDIEKDQHGIVAAIVQIYMKPQRNIVYSSCWSKSSSGIL